MGFAAMEGKPSSAATHVSLLLRLTRPGPTDQAAWGEFVRHYGPTIYRWCRRWHLQDADAQDVTQQVLFKLARTLSGFSYDPGRSFRAWLHTLTHHAWHDFIVKQNRPGRGSGDSDIHEMLDTVEAREDLLRRLEEEYDRELLALATQRVRERVEPETWETYQLNAVEGVSATEVGRRLGKKVATVYVLRSKVQRLLREEVQKLMAEDQGQQQAGET